MRQLLLLSFLLLTLAGFSQNTQYLGSPGTTIDSRGPFAFAIKDTTFTPIRAGVVVYRAADSSLYVSVATTGHKWQKVGTGSGSSLTDTLAADSLWKGGFITGGNLYAITLGGDTVLVGSVGAALQHFANTDLSATGNRSHNWKGYDLVIDSLYNFRIKSRTQDFPSWKASLRVSSEEGNTLDFFDSSAGISSYVGSSYNSAEVTVHDDALSRIASRVLATKDSLHLQADTVHLRGVPYLHTLDSTNTPMNMLWRDATGQLHLAAVPSGSSTTITNNFTQTTPGTAADAVLAKILKDTTAQQRTDINTHTANIATNTASIAGKIDSVKLVSDSLKSYKNGVATGIAKIAKIFYPTTPATGDLLRYNATDTTWRNAPMVNSTSTSVKSVVWDTVAKSLVYINSSALTADSLKVTNTEPSGGINVWLDSTVKRIKYRVYTPTKKIIYTVAVQDSVIYNLPSGLTLALTFTNRTGFNFVGADLVATAGTWAGNEAVADQYLPAGIDGKIYMTHVDGTTKNAMIGLSTTNSLETYTSLPYGVYINTSDGKYYSAEGGTIANTGVTATAGDLFGIDRTGGVVKVVYSNNSGATWTAIKTFTTNTTAQLYIKATAIGTGQTIKTPKGVNVDL